MEQEIKQETEKSKEINKIDIKSNWLKEDELCPSCGKVTKKANGITKQHLKQLFSFNFKKDGLNSLIIIGILFILYNASITIKEYNGIMNNPYDFCSKAMSEINKYGQIDKVNDISGNENGLGLDGILKLNNSNSWTS